MRRSHFDGQVSRPRGNAGLSLCGVGLALIVLFLFAHTGVAGARSPIAVQPAMAAPQVVTPTLLAVSPGEAPNNLDMTLTLTGTDFQAVLSDTEVLTAPAVHLDGFALSAVGWISSTSLTATVPWGLDPGVYTATVTNPEGGVGSLPRAFTVTQAIGVWTSSGPYGGYVQGLAAHPTISSTAYVLLDRIGLFKTTNAGEWWEGVRLSGRHSHYGLFALKPDNPQVVLSGDPDGLYQSLDGGETWAQLLPGNAGPIAFAPPAPDWVYVAIDGNEVQVSADGGQTWHSPGAVIPAGVVSLAVHPLTETIAYAGADGGRIFRTTNGGDSWQELTTGLPEETVRRLMIDPHSPNRLYVTDWHGGTLFHRSLDGGQTWQPMSMDLGKAMNDFAFHPTISGTVYAMTAWGLYGSTDAGATWDHLSDAPGCMWSLALDPNTGEPLYCGANAQGVLRSSDGGITWTVVNEGLQGLQPWDLAAQPTIPEQVYAVAEEAGGYASRDAGQSWRVADTATHGQGDPDQVVTAAVDPKQSCVGYLGGMWTVYKTTDCGATWSTYWLPGDHPAVDTTYALAVDPHDSTIVYAGIGRFPAGEGAEYGMVFTSTDGGVTWQEIDVGRPISPVTEIVFDPLVTGTIYLATGKRTYDVGPLNGGTVLKSTDGGFAWGARDQGLTGRPVNALILDPLDPDRLYAALYEFQDPTSEGGIFRSVDGGESWARASTGLPFHDFTSLVLDPRRPESLWVGMKDHGLFVSSDGGNTWMRASGPFGYASIFSMAVGATEDRTIIYIGTPGGVIPILPRGLQAATVIGGGVYQQTVVHRPPAKIYLPLVLRDY